MLKIFCGVLFSCFLNMCAMAKVPFWDSSEVVVEGHIISSKRVLGIDAHGSVVSFEELNQITNKFEDVAKVEIWMDVICVSQSYKGGIKIGANYPIFYKKRPSKLAKYYRVPILGKKLIGKEVGTRKVFFIDIEKTTDSYRSWKDSNVFIVEHEKLSLEFRKFLETSK